MTFEYRRALILILNFFFFFLDRGRTIYFFYYLKKIFFLFLFFNRFYLFVCLLVYLFIYWLHLVFVVACRLSLVVGSEGYSSLRCVGFSLRWLLLLWSMGSRHVGFSSCGSRASVVVVHGI